MIAEIYFEINKIKLAFRITNTYFRQKSVNQDEMF